LERAISALLVAAGRKGKKTAAVCEKHAMFFALMAILKKNAFSRRVPDLVTEELVAVLSRRSSFEFKQLFDIVHENLRARNAASGGEEMLRLRAYEKLQNLVARGAVKKNGKKYKGLPSALANAIAQQNGHLAGVR
jgi:predicted nucleic acid-binding protein